MLLLDKHPLSMAQHHQCKTTYFSFNSGGTSRHAVFDSAYPAIKRRLKRLPMIPQLPKAVDRVAKHPEQMKAKLNGYETCCSHQEISWLKCSHGRKHYGFPHNEEIILLFDYNEYTSFTLFKNSHSMEHHFVLVYNNYK